MIKALAVSKCFCCWCYILLLIALAAGALHTLALHNAVEICFREMPDIMRLTLAKRFELNRYSVRGRILVIYKLIRRHDYAASRPKIFSNTGITVS